MRRITWDNVLVGLTLVHIGQQLGSDTKLARAVAEILTVIVSFFGHVSQVPA